MSTTIYHWHHRIPTHAGGPDDPSHRITLTIEEHAEAHRLLWEPSGRLDDRAAWRGLSGFTAGHERTMRELTKRNVVRGASHWTSGKKLSAEHRAKIRAARTGKMSGANTPWYGNIHSDETRAKMRAAPSRENHHRYGKTLSTETRAKIRAGVLRRHRLRRGGITAPEVVLSTTPE